MNVNIGGYASIMAGDNLGTSTTLDGLSLYYILIWFVHAIVLTKQVCLYLLLKIGPSSMDIGSGSYV